MPIQRHIKNVVNNYTETQRKVREATCSDPWGPSSTLMAEIADKTHNFVAFGEIMEIILRRLNDKGKNWLHVFKSLVLLEYLVKAGHESVAIQCREHIHFIETLKLFEYDENGKDYGLRVRMKAQALSELLRDEERLNEERAKALLTRDRLMQTGFGGANSSLPTMPRINSQSSRSQIPQYNSLHFSKSSPFRSPRTVTSDLDSMRPKSIGEEQLQIQFALAASKEEHDREEQRRRSEEAKDEAKLQLALEQSRKEEQQAASGLRSLVSTSAPNVPPNPAAQTDFDNLLDIPTPAPVPTPFHDPWSTQPSQPVNDPFAQGLIASSTTNPIPIDDPWSTRNSTAFGQPVAPQFWATASVSPVPASGSPFNVSSPGPQSTNNGTVTDTNNTSQSAGETGAGKDEAAPRKRTPADFLGEHQGLVDLDKLIETNPVSTNPFAVSVRTDKNPTSINPFLVNQPVKPSLNQLAPAFRPPTLWNQPHQVAPPSFGALPPPNAFTLASNAFMQPMQSNPAPWGVPTNAMAQQRPTSSNPFY